jgi:5-methylcytosine-specific restriction protein A
MPIKPKNPCRRPGCPLLTEKTYCYIHEKQQRKQADAGRLNSRQRGYTPRWEKLRKWFLMQSPLCALCESQGVITAANEVDHIIPHKGDKVLFWDVKNLQSLCKSCHSRKSQQEKSGWKYENIQKNKASKTQVVVVYGPPGAGKTTYVLKKMRPGDLILDSDRLWQALSGQAIHDKPISIFPFMLEAWHAVLNRLKANNNILCAWIVTTGKRKQDIEMYENELNAQCFVMETPAIVCLRRVQNDKARDPETMELFKGLIDQWWQDYDRPKHHKVIINKGET